MPVPPVGVGVLGARQRGLGWQCLGASQFCWRGRGPLGRCLVSAGTVAIGCPHVGAVGMACWGVGSATAGRGGRQASSRARSLYRPLVAGRHNQRPLDTRDQMRAIARGMPEPRLLYLELIAYRNGLCAGRLGGDGKREPLPAARLGQRVVPAPSASAGWPIEERVPAHP